MRIIGIDPSLSSTGICVMGGENIKYYLITSTPEPKRKILEIPDNVEIIRFNRLEPKSTTESKQDAILQIRNIIHEILIKEIVGDISIAIEGPSYNSKGNAYVDLFGLNYVIRLLCKDITHNWPQVIPPACIKGLATGKGNAGKDMMVDAWLEEQGEMHNTKGMKLDDLCDSYWLVKKIQENQ